jgi:hypothetical protein
MIMVIQTANIHDSIGAMEVLRALKEKYIRVI